MSKSEFKPKKSLRRRYSSVTTFSPELVSVVPLSPPSGKLFYFESTYGTSPNIKKIVLSDDEIFENKKIIDI